MSHPWSGTDDSRESVDCALLSERIAAFGASLAGTLRQDAIVQHLVTELVEALAPAEVVVQLHPGASGEATLTTTWPVEGADREAVLQHASVAGTVTYDDGRGTWIIGTIVARRRVIGVAAMRDAAGPYRSVAGPLLAAMLSAAAIALESARLIDVYDDGRRSWQEVVDAIELALCIVDGEPRIRRANRAFAEFVNAPPAVIVGRPLESFLPVEWQDDVHRLVTRATGSSVELRSAGRVYCARAIAVGEEESSATVLLFEDTTDAQALQEQLLQTTKLSAMGHLIAGVAHELNNPLASVVGFADFLGELRDVPPNLREPLAVIREEAERASGIVRNLLSFARKHDHQRGPTDLAGLLQNTMALLRNPLMASRVEAVLQLEPELPAVVMDASKVQQVFVNLITNAAQAIASTGRPGTVTIHARRFLDGVTVDITDDGPGMAETVAGRIFDPFFTTKGEQSGTGLGLPISQGIVREHGGRITVETEEGRGATFSVYLPLGEMAPASRPRDEEPATRPVTRSLKVLVVDDEPHILHYMRSTLEAWGHAVTVATDGDEALAACLAAEPDMVISDLRMHRMGGRELYEELTRQRPALARSIFFSTGDTVRGDTLTFLESLDRPWLHKPFGLAELRALLSAAGRAIAGRDSGGWTTPADDPDAAAPGRRNR